MDKQKLTFVFEQFCNYKILIVGDVMIDSYLWGRVDRISPEAPVPVVSSTKIENRLGGAANVALNIQTLGATPVLCSVIGDDENSVIFNDLLKKRELVTEGIIRDKSRATTVKTRIISSSQHILRVDRETTKHLDADLEKQFLQHVSEQIDKHRINAIIFQDYDKGVLTSGLIAGITGIACSKNIPVLVDPKKKHFSDFKNVTLFKPNFKELIEGLKLDGFKKNETEQIKQAANILHESQNIRIVLITLSEYGIFASSESGSCSLPAVIRDIADVSGAGDTVISVAALCLLSEMSLHNLAAVSNLAGGIVCEKVGVVPVSKKQLLDECVEFFGK